MVSGFLAGTVSTTLLLPLDVIKVRMQVHEGTEERGSQNVSKQPAATRTRSPQPTNPRNPRRIGAFQLVRGILRYEGVQGLFVGWTPAVFGSAVSWGGYFFVYEAFKKKWLTWKTDLANRSKNDNKNSQSQIPSQGKEEQVSLNSLDFFMLSCGAGAVMVALTNPIWLIKTRMQLQMKKASEQNNVRPYNGMLDAFRTILRQEGPLALYRGSGAAFLLTSNGGIQFVVYETLRKYYHMQNKQMKAQRSSGEENQLTILERFVTSLGYMTIGATAKVVASTLTYPLQVAKSRIQQRAEALEFTGDGHVRVVQRHYAGLFETLQRTVTAEGISGLFKGCIPNALRVAPNAAVTFVVYEITMDMLSSSARH